MGRLVYFMNVSLDGYIESADGDLDWSVVDDELHAWFNEQSRTTDAFLYGRRLYETMAAYWPTAESDPEANEVMLEFARIWNATPKVVFSSSLTSVESNCRLVNGDVGELLERLRSEFDGDLSVGGATLAASFIARGLVDEYRLVVHPVILGGGKSFFPALPARNALRLVETHRFGSGVVYLRYVATDGDDGGS